MDRSSGGTSMSSPDAGSLDEGDAWPRWWGVTRHRLILSVVALVVGADALVRPGSRGWEWFLAAGAAGAAAPKSSTESWGRWISVEIRYLLRRRVHWVSLEREGDALRVATRGSRRVWCYEFVHRGRLDLSGGDVTLATRLARMTEALATGGARTHLALHVDTGQGSGVDARTTLSVSVDSAVPQEWRRRNDGGVPRSLSLGRVVVIERRRYVRTPLAVVHTLRASDFAAGRASEALEALGQYGTALEISLHAGVVPRDRARRLTARAVHRMGADAHLSRGAGFRWSARDQRGLDAVGHREYAVTQGAALCQWALYVAVSAPNVGDLRRRVLEVRELARARGLRLDAGTGVQGDWFTYQLPGGPGW